MCLLLLYIVTAPQIALPLWDIYKHILTPQTRNILFIYGKDKKDWQRILLKEIDKDQLSRKLGGTKEDNAVDVFEYLRNVNVFRCENL